jgi:hypothetical protein
MGMSPTDIMVATFTTPHDRQWNGSGGSGHHRQRPEQRGIHRHAIDPPCSTTRDMGQRRQLGQDRPAERVVEFHSFPLKPNTQYFLNILGDSLSVKLTPK